MKQDSQITQELFDALLEWLSPDRDMAGRKYEEIRKGLVRFFLFRGCDEPDTLADETINRVAKKLSSFNFEKNVQTITYFYSFASNIYLEDVARRKKRVVLDDIERNLAGVTIHPAHRAQDAKLQCLEECLRQRPESERALVIRYYAGEKAEKFEIRKAIASELCLNLGALHTKVHRVRALLRKCIELCLNKGSL